MSEATISIPASRPRSVAHRLLGDDVLARLVGRGDQHAFSTIFERHHQGIYRYCLSILHEPEDASDALQNTMFKAMQGMAGGEREIALKPWLYRIAHNESISLLRRRRPQEEIGEQTVPVAGDAHDHAAARARLSELVSDLQELPERQRGALVMRELNGLEYGEIAAAFSVSPGAAKQTLYEARTALHDFAEGRAMECDEARRAISDGDRRVIRGRKIRAHLRDCPPCRDFEAVLATRKADLAALAPPLPPVAAAGVLQSIFGGGAGGSGGSGGLLAGGGAAAGATQAAVVVAVVVGAGAGIVGVARGVMGSDEPEGAKPKAGQQALPPAPAHRPPSAAELASRRKSAERRAEAKRAEQRQLRAKRRAESEKEQMAKAEKTAGAQSGSGNGGSHGPSGSPVRQTQGGGGSGSYPGAEDGSPDLGGPGQQLRDRVRDTTGIDVPRTPVTGGALPVSPPKVDVPKLPDVKVPNLPGP